MNPRWRLLMPAALGLSMLLIAPAFAQSEDTPRHADTARELNVAPSTETTDPTARVSPSEGQEPARNVDLLNPLSVLDSAGRVIPREEGEGEAGFSTTISIVLMLTVLTLVPALLVMCTSFTRIVVVLALLRQAIGTQALPPSQVIIGLSLFLTILIMAPTFEKINRDAIVPLQNHDINQKVAWDRAQQPLRDFMIDQITYAGNEKDVLLLLKYRGVDTSQPESLDWDRDVDLITLIPSFILSELKVAFLMGFRLYLPFLVIDMVIASVLISMGMLMLPPVLVSLPFKLLLFVLVDGWHLIAGNLLSSFAVPGVTT